MVTILVRIINEGGIVSYFSQGHVKSDDIKSDDKVEQKVKLKIASKVCSGLSAIEYQFLYSVQLLCPSLSVNCIVRDGYFEYTSKKMNELSTERNYVTLSRSFLIGIEMLKKNYPELMHVKISKV